jgi:mRNA interferase MazF
MTHQKVRGASQDDQIRLVNAIRRGDVLLVDLGSARGKEQKKQRPCVVVSNNVLYKDGDTLIVVPISTHGGKGKAKAYEVQLKNGDGGLEQDAAAMPHQVRTIDARERVVEIWGHLSENALFEVEAMLHWATSDADP